MSLDFFFGLISLVFCNLVAKLKIEGDQKFIFLFDDLLIACQKMQFFEISKLIRQSFSKKFVVVFSWGDILGKDGLFVQSGVNILFIEPIIRALMFHNLQNSASINLSNIFIMQMFI